MQTERRHVAWYVYNVLHFKISINKQKKYFKIKSNRSTHLDFGTSYLHFAEIH